MNLNGARGGRAGLGGPGRGTGGVLGGHGEEIKSRPGLFYPAQKELLFYCKLLSGKDKISVILGRVK